MVVTVLFLSIILLNLFWYTIIMKGFLNLIIGDDKTTDYEKANDAVHSETDDLKNKNNLKIE